MSDATQRLDKIERSLCYREVVNGLERVPPYKVDTALGQVALLRRDVEHLTRELETARETIAAMGNMAMRLVRSVEDAENQLDAIWGTARRHLAANPPQEGSEPQEVADA